jgi:hypothetical protein
MLAASRKDRVNGRTRTLDDSISTRNGFNQSGAPSGRKWAAASLGLYKNLELTRLNHNGKPRDNVMIRCLDNLKQYGIKPIRFSVIAIINVVTTKIENPFKDVDVVRLNWENITSRVFMHVDISR